MLKLNASFSKKVPGSQQYSSEGFMASVEVEIPDGLNEQQLKEKIHQTFNLVQNSVETELQNNAAQKQVSMQVTPQVNHAAPATSAVTEANGFVPAQPSVTERNGESVSPKQLKYLTDLLKDTGHDASVFLQSRGIKTIYELSRVQCSQLIDLIKEQHVKAA